MYIFPDKTYLTYVNRKS